MTTLSPNIPDALAQIAVLKADVTREVDLCDFAIANQNKAEAKLAAERAKVAAAVTLLKQIKNAGFFPSAIFNLLMKLKGQKL
jgi:hypothetical protein